MILYPKLFSKKNTFLFSEFFADAVLAKVLLSEICNARLELLPTKTSASIAIWKRYSAASLRPSWYPFNCCNHTEDIASRTELVI